MTNQQQDTDLVAFAISGAAMEATRRARIATDQAVAAVVDELSAASHQDPSRDDMTFDTELVTRHILDNINVANPTAYVWDICGDYPDRLFLYYPVVVLVHDALWDYMWSQMVDAARDSQVVDHQAVLDRTWTSAMAVFDRHRLWERLDALTTHWRYLSYLIEDLYS